MLASDSRTNAGVDYISSYSKMTIFQPAPDRLFVLLAAGSLATTQAPPFCWGGRSAVNRAKAPSRIDRLIGGNPGDVKPARAGVS